MTDMNDYEWLTDDEQRFWQMLVSAFRSVERNIEATLRENTGLTFGDFTVLIALTETEDGVMHVDDLCRRLKWNHPRALLHTTRMEKRGVISVEDPGADPDSDYTVALTGVGRHVFAEAAPDYVATVRSEVFERLSDDDVDTMSRCFTAILRNSENGNGPNLL
ncbi:MarR family winged helix-turn-helix transcriptional regulator [Corynebacterium freneyi]|uniref:MarR family winged helix-turn-helix transcriptional regulator n=2 Tax=Corynebacterium freneyi TaxID=134034 RepID=UPI000B1C9897|nr:MarR family winged helix-turn-helix transcriptional regulator [Corynebacterium freneyi]